MQQYYGISIIHNWDFKFDVPILVHVNHDENQKMNDSSKPSLTEIEFSIN